MKDNEYKIIIRKCCFDMEKLFVYAILYSVGYDVWKEYEEELDRLYLDNTDAEAS